MPKLYGYTEILGDMLITGSFSILGSASIINTTNLVVNDPIFVLANGQTGSPVLDSGFFVNRGTGATQGFIWDESSVEFAMIQTSDNHTAIGNVNISSYANLRLGNIGVGGAIPSNTTAYIKGTSSTSTDFALKVDNSSNNPLLYVRNDGNVGIGINFNPTEILHVYKSGFNSANVLVESDTATANLILNSFKNGYGTSGGSNILFNSIGVNLGSISTTSANTSFGISAFNYYSLILSANTTNNYVNIGGAYGDGISITTDNAIRLFINKVGNIGIGGLNLYDNPTAKLHVRGIDNTSSNFAVKIESASASSLLSVRNDGFTTLGTTLLTSKLSIGAGNVSVEIGYGYSVGDFKIFTTDSFNAESLLIGKGTTGTNAIGEAYIAIGRSSNSTELGIAIGAYTSIGAGSYDGIAIGRAAITNVGSVRSVSIGRNANSQHNNSWALGFNAVTTQDNEFNFGAAAVHQKSIFNGSVGFNGSSLGGGVRVFFKGFSSTIPTTNPTGGVVDYVENVGSGVQKYRDTSGTIIAY